MDLWEIVLSILVVLAGGSGIFSLVIKARLDELRAIEERLTAERRKIYLDILAPYIRLFAAMSRGELNKIDPKQLTTSDEYRRVILELGLLGSDEVVRAYNALTRYYFKLGASEKPDPREAIRLLGELRLEIRKSLGNKKTKLDAFDMLRGEVIDIEKWEGTKHEATP